MAKIVELKITDLEISSEEMSGELFDSLIILAQQREMLVEIKRGFPSCAFCDYSVGTDYLQNGETDRVVVSALIIIPSGADFFLLPTLAWHYVEIHKVKLPDNVISAIKSMRYTNDKMLEMRRRFSETDADGRYES